MQPSSTLYRNVMLRVAKKEMTLFFASPIGYLFLTAFAAFSLFVFFWGEAFFARNIADVRPLFESMPVLLIFLASALTMRLWSEERRTGTLEHVLTQPVPLVYFVLGKFIGCLALLLIALIITIPLPVSVALIGELDWGPVLSGYLATFLLGAAYLSIGIFVSSRTQNQIVSLLVSVAVCGFFYILGIKTLTQLVGYEMAEWLGLFATGARFESITRGVLDLRDLFYYLSLIVVFLSLNTYSLERERWASSGTQPNHNAWRTVTALFIVNALVGNLWLSQVSSLRLDTTSGKQYSISDATKTYLQQLQEPLLLRGYFSEKTHPLLSPLVPQLRDLIREYEEAADGRVRVEFIDPTQNPEIEDEANRKYGIQAVPFQVADRYQAAIVSSYFNVLVQYGDQHETLGFNDFIEVKARSESDIDVQLRNPEHDLTRAIKKVLKSYQAGGNLFDTIEGNVTFNAYISDEKSLPNELQAFKSDIERVLEINRALAGDQLQINFLQPEANNGKVAQQIQTQYGFQPMTTNLFSNESFYFYLTLAKGEQIVQIPLEDMTEDSFKRNFDAALKRFSSGFTKTVAMVRPATNPQLAQYGMAGAQFNQLESFLGAELNVISEDLSDGIVTGEADILLLLSPKDLNETSVFAVDQFLMQGGTVIAATSPYSAQLTQRNMMLQDHNSGLDDWLKHHGISIDKSLVLDPQNAAFPVPVTRNVGAFSVQEIRMLDYPYFVDVRGDGLNEDNLITGDVPQVTMAWASPIRIDEEKNAQRAVTPLIHSSNSAWLSSSKNIMPTIEGGKLAQFSPSGDTDRHLLGAITEGEFNSYFTGKPSPLLVKEQNGDPEENDNATETSEQPFALDSVIEKSSSAARIIVFSSNDFLRDQVVGMLGSATGSQYLNSLQLAANTVDWSLEDVGLLSIRSRGHFNRTLPPMEKSEQQFWEYLNYGFAALALVAIALIQRLRSKRQQRHYQQLMTA